MKKSRRLLAALLAVFVLAAVLAGCGTKSAQNTETQPPASDNNADTETPEPTAPSVPQEIIYNLGEEPPSLDPAIMTDLTSFAAVNALFEGLVRITPDGISPGMATDWEISDDQVHYTFHLRKDAKWTNGDPVTAHDFVYAWRRALDPRTASDYAYQLYYIKGGQAANETPAPAEDDDEATKAAKAKAIDEALQQVAVVAKDDYTLEVELVSPAPYFLGLTAFPTLLPVNQKVAQANANWAAEAASYVSNGPFRLVEWTHKDKLVMEKNENYWDAATVKITKITMPMVVEASTGLTMFENGELDITDPPTADIQRLLAEGSAKTAPLLGTYYYLVNNQKPPFNDIRVRKALAMAIDRKAITDGILKAGQLPAYAYVPPGIPNPVSGKDFREERGDFFKEDLAEAKRLLAEAGFPDGKGFPAFTLLYNTNEAHKAIAEAIQNMWKENLGIENITLQNQDWAVFLDSRTSLNYDVARSGWIGDYLDPMTFIDMWASNSGNNDSGWKNTDYDAYVETAKMSADQAARYDAMHKAEDLLMNDMAIIPIYYYVETYMEQPWIKGVLRTALGVTDFKWATVEEH